MILFTLNQSTRPGLSGIIQTALAKKIQARTPMKQNISLDFKMQKRLCSRPLPAFPPRVSDPEAVPESWIRILVTITEFGGHNNEQKVI